MKKTKILLISPPLSGDLNSGILSVKTPLGLLYIAAYLEKFGYKPEVLDCMAYYETVLKKDNGSYRVGLSEEKIIEKLKDFNPDVVGITCSFTVYERNSVEIAKLVKKYTQAKVVFGGAHSSANPKEVLKNKEIDLVCIGEGELTFFKIIEALEKKRDLNKISGTAVRVGNKIKLNPSQDYIKDLDSIPFPARHLVPMEKYLQHPENAIASMRRPTTEIVSSRGCPFNCIFCSIQTVWGRKWRARSAKNVVDEMQLLYDKYGVREFRFFDDNISWDKKRMIEICNEIINRDLDIKWDTPNGIAISTLDKEVLKKMKQAGYYKAIFGIESGCVDTLRKIRKPVSLDYSKRIVDICNKNGIWTWSTFVIGFPFEDESSIKQTMNFAKSSGLDFITVYVAQPYVGTDMYKMFEEMGLMKEGVKKGSSIVNTKYDTQHFTAEELSVWQKRIYSEFIKHKMLSYLNPIVFYKNFLRKIRSFEDLNYVFRMSLNLAGRKYSPIYKKKATK